MVGRPFYCSMIVRYGNVPYGTLPISLSFNTSFPRVEGLISFVLVVAQGEALNEGCEDACGAQVL